MSKTIVTITGIRPDFIRMADIFKLLDRQPEFKHIFIHSGQHRDYLLSDVFFRDLDIRQPDYFLESRGKHYEQSSYLSSAVIRLFKQYDINPDLIIFLGDSNTVSVAPVLKKHGYKVCHIEAGMRSYDKRMLEEINRTICDHSSDVLFVYHQDYKEQLARENICDNIHVVGNTIVEVCNNMVRKLGIFSKPKKHNIILLDIHRPENFKFPDRLRSIITFANVCSKHYNVPVKLLKFNRTMRYINKFQVDLKGIELSDLMSFPDYLQVVYDSIFIISDSGTAQEEPALIHTPVIVPRDYSERPQSYISNCSYKLNVFSINYDEVFKWIDAVNTGDILINTDWLGDGDTARLIVKNLVSYLKK